MQTNLESTMLFRYWNHILARVSIYYPTRHPNYQQRSNERLCSRRSLFRCRPIWKVQCSSDIGTISSQEYPSIILHAIRIINNAVTSDSAHAGHFFDADQSGKYNALPTTFSGTSLSKESKLGNILKEITAAPKKGGEGETEPDVPGEFLYNFHSKFHKWPGQPFSMDVKPVGMNNEVPGLQGVKIEVIWNCNKTLNRIYVIADKNGKKTKPLMIMQFYDHHVSSQAGATGGGTNQFSVEKLVQASNPTAGSKLASAPPEIREAIQKESETLMRSLMATTYRKPMEFKSKRGKKVFPLKWDEAGNVTYKDAEGIAQTIDHNGVTEKLEGDFEDSQKWADSLEHFGYFEAFPGKKPKDIDEYRSEEHTSELQSLRH